MAAAPPEAHRPGRAPGAPAALLQLPRWDVLPELRGNSSRRRLCCVETVRKAIRRLEAAGIISTLRRKVVTRFVSQVHRVRFDVAVQTSNSYAFAMPSGAPLAAAPQPQP